MCYFYCLAGSLSLNLNHMPLGAKQAKGAKLSMLGDVGADSKVKYVSLFEMKRIKGFWPCYSDEKGEKELTVSQT